MLISRPNMIALFLLFLCISAFAEDYVVVNSYDGRDVLTGIFYANAKGEPVKFMTPNADADLFASTIGTGHSILLIQSSKPVSTFVQNSLTSHNNTVELYQAVDGQQTNLDMAARSGASSFIVVDSAYSDSSLSVLSYAAYSKSYILLANKDIATQVAQIAKGKKVIIFGLVDSEVTKALSSSNPQVIGNGQDKFVDNLAMVQKTMDDYKTNEFIMVDGSKMEDSIAAGKMPIILTGSSLVPQPTYDFIDQALRQGKIKSVLLIGNDLVMPIYDMRHKMVTELNAQGINKTFGIVVKFAQVIPSAGTTVMNLNTFPLPAYKPSLNISEVSYNQPSKQLMVSVANTGDGAAYYTMEIRVQVDGSDYKVFPSSAPALIERGDSAGTQLDFDMSQIKSGNVTANVLVKYGSSSSSLESFTSKIGPLTTISYVDESNVSVQSAKYDSDKKSVLITLKNNGAQTAYEFTKVGLMIGGSPVNITGSGAKEIQPSSLVVEELPLELSDADLAANKNIHINVAYGARQGFLLKNEEYTLPLSIGTGLPIWLILLVVAIIIVLIAAAAFFFLMKKK